MNQQKEEELVLETRDYNKKIEDLLKLETNTELEVEDEITEKLLSPESSNPGCKVAFVGSYKRHSDVDDWVEYRVLYKVIRYKDTPEYLNTAIGFIKDSMSHLNDIDCDSAGLQEVYCIDPFNYYMLVYIIK